MARKTHCKHGHEYIESNAYLYKGTRICRTCNRANARERYKRLLDDPEKYDARLEYSRNYQRVHKSELSARVNGIIAFVRSHKTACCYCGEDHPACLDFHHRDPDDKSFPLTKAHIGHRSLESIEKEIAKCDVTCSNCHRKLHYSLKEID